MNDRPENKSGGFAFGAVFVWLLVLYVAGFVVVGYGAIWIRRPLPVWLRQGFEVFYAPLDWVLERLGM